MPAWASMVSAGSAGSDEAGKGKGQMPPWFTTLAMKGIELPTKGQGKGKTMLDSVTPKLIRTPCHDTAGVLSRPVSQPRPASVDAGAAASQPRPASVDAGAATQDPPRPLRLDEIGEQVQVLGEQVQVLEQRSAKLHDEILQRLEVLEQRTEMILNLLRAQLSGLD